jgi:hypothetical protein
MKILLLPLSLVLLAQNAYSTSRCEIKMTDCPAHRGMYALPAFTDMDYLSGNLSSHNDVNRCMNRAQEYYGWCGNSVPVTTVFYDGNGSVTAQTTYPNTKCEITMLSCPAHPHNVLLPTTLDQDYLLNNLSNRDANRCMNRAQEYFSYCGSLLPVTATFSDASGNKLSQGTYPSGFPTNSVPSVVIQQVPTTLSLNTNITATVNTWAPGSPRYVKNRKGTFAVLLTNTPRNNLIFNLQKRSGSGWQTLVSNLGPAVSDPILLTDDWDRLHILFPASQNKCDAGYFGFSNIIHILAWEENGVWKTLNMATASIAATSTCLNFPQTQRFGGAVSRRDQLLYLVYYDLAGNPNRHGFASFNLNTLRWNKAVSVPGSATPNEGVGYAYVAPGANSGEVSFISTVYDNSGNYVRVDSFKSSDYGVNFNKIELCNSRQANKSNCLTGDILLDSKNHTHMVFYVDSKNGGYSSLTNTQTIANQQISYIFSYHHWGVAFPILDAKLGVNSPSPSWNVSLNEVNGRLVAVGAYGGNRLGAWVSSDEGITWTFTDISNRLADPSKYPYQVMLYKPQWGGVTETTLMQGLYTDNIQNAGDVRTSEVKFFGF